MEQVTEEKLVPITADSRIAHTTISLQRKTKERLDNSKAPGQCYDDFIYELVGYWERYKIGSSLCGPGKPVNQTMER